MSELADVIERDCVLSMAPLKLGMGVSRVRGSAAILRRVLYKWCTLLGTVIHAPDLGVPTPLLDLDGATYAPSDIAGIRAQLTKQAKTTEFVIGASVPVTSIGGLLIVRGQITLTDQKTYPLEVGPADAFAAFGGFGRLLSLSPEAQQSLIDNGVVL